MTENNRSNAARIASEGAGCRLCLAATWLLAVLALSGCDGSEATGPTPPGDPDVNVTQDLAFASTVSSQAEPRLLDVYAPAEAGDWPVAVFLHGGSASKEHSEVVAFSQRLSAEGVVVFVPTYGGGPPDHVISQGGRVMREFLETVACAVRYARQRGDDFNGDPSRLTVIGHSAGGVFGSLVSLLQDEVDTMWEDRILDRGGPLPQIDCPSGSVRVTGFVGFNGAYFVFKALGLPDSDPEFWNLVNLNNHIGKNRSLVVRFIFGKRDATQPGWHVTDANQFINDLRTDGYDADTVQVDASHNFNFAPAAWEKTLETTLEVVRR